MSPYTGIFGEAGFAPEVTPGTFVAPVEFVRFVPPFDFSDDATLLESKGVSGIADAVTKVAQGPAQLKSGKIKFEVEPEGGLGRHLYAAFGTDTVTEVASFIVVTGTNDTVDWGSSFTVAVPAGTYAAGLTHATAGSLCAAIYTAMHGQDSTVSEVSFSPATKEFTITFNSGTPSIKWNTGTHTAKSLGPLIGFPTSADSTGAATYTGAAVVMVGSHAFSRVQNAQIPSFSWWQNQAGLDYPTFAGCILSKIEFDIKAKEYVEASADWIGLKYAAGSTEAAVYSTHQPFEWDQCVVTVAGSPVVDYEEIKLTIDNMGENVHCVGSSVFATKNYSKGFKVSLSMTLTVENTTEWAKYVAGTLSSLTLALTSTEMIKGSIPFSLTFTMTNIAYKAAPRPMPKDLIKITFSADATSSVNASTTLTATLVNSDGIAFSSTH